MKDDQETESLTEWLRESLTVAAPATRGEAFSMGESAVKFSFTLRFSEVTTLGHDDFSRSNSFRKNRWETVTWDLDEHSTPR